MVIASTAIPGAFAPVPYKDFYLADGAISSNTPVRVAVAKGARLDVTVETRDGAHAEDIMRAFAAENFAPVRIDPGAAMD